MLQTFFGMAVQSNTKYVQAMAKACWAALMHKVADANDKNPHRFPPPLVLTHGVGISNGRLGLWKKNMFPKAVYHLRFLRN